jgi:hypothetical protein
MLSCRNLARIEFSPNSDKRQIPTKEKAPDNPRALASRRQFGGSLERGENEAGQAGHQCPARNNALLRVDQQRRHDDQVDSVSQFLKWAAARKSFDTLSGAGGLPILVTSDETDSSSRFGLRWPL